MVYETDNRTIAEAVDDLVVAHHHLRRAVDRTQPSVDSRENGFEWPGDA